MERALRDRGLRPCAKAMVAVIHQAYLDSGRNFQQILIGFKGAAAATGMCSRSMVRARWALEARGHFRVRPGGGAAELYCGGDRRARAAGRGVTRWKGRGGCDPGGVGRANGYSPAQMPEPPPDAGGDPPPASTSSTSPRRRLAEYLGPDPRAGDQDDRGP